MFIKWLSLIVFAVAVAAGLLVFRQQQIDAMHVMTRQHARMHSQQQALWMLQSDIASNLQPDSLREALERAQLELEPDVADPPAGLRQPARLVAR